MAWEWIGLIRLGSSYLCLYSLRWGLLPLISVSSVFNNGLDLSHDFTLQVGLLFAFVAHDQQWSFSLHLEGRI